MTVDKGKGERIVVRDVVYHGGMCPRCEGMGSVSDIDLSQLFDDSKSLNEGALTIPGYTADGWHVRIFAAAGLDPDKPIRKYTQEGARGLPLQRAEQGEGREHQPHLRGPGPADPEVVPVQGRRRDAAAHPRVRGARGHVHHLSRVRAARGSTRPPGRRRSRRSTSPTPARCRSTTWPSGCAV